MQGLPERCNRGYLVEEPKIYSKEKGHKARYREPRNRKVKERSEDGQGPRVTSKPVKLRRSISAYRMQSLLKKDMAANDLAKQEPTIVIGAQFFHRRIAVDIEGQILRANGQQMRI
jgi:hypothetical protein